MSARKPRSSKNTLLACVSTPDHGDLRPSWIEVDRRTFGRDLLDSVCRDLRLLEIGCQFGLQYTVGDKDVWLKMDERVIKQDVPKDGFQISFKLRVIPPPERCRYYGK